MGTGSKTSIHRPRGKTLGVPELIAIALGGMVGGGIFTILGISVAMVGAYTPLAIALAVLIYIVIAYGAIVAIPFQEIVRNKEYALASGSGEALGHWGTELVIVGALLATRSAISGTVFGASRQMAVIAADGFFPSVLARRVNSIPVAAIACLSAFSFLLILAGSLEVILEFGSVTFLLVSLLMAYANFRIRHRTGSSLLITSLALLGLTLGTALILYFEFSHQPRQLLFILVLYTVLTLGSLLFSRLTRLPAPRHPR